MAARDWNEDALYALVRRAWFQLYGPRTGFLRWLWRFLGGQWSAADQRFEVVQRGRVERGLARDRQARGSLAVEHRQGEQVLVRDPPHAPFLEALDQVIEPPPVAFAREAELVRAQARRLDAGRRLDSVAAQEGERDHRALQWWPASFDMLRTSGLCTGPEVR